MAASKKDIDAGREKSDVLVGDLASARDKLASALKEIDALKRRTGRRATKATAVSNVDRRPASRSLETEPQLPKEITVRHLPRPKKWSEQKFYPMATPHDH